VNYRKTELEQAMLMNLHKRNWTEGLKLRNFEVHKQENEKAVKVSLIFFCSCERAKAKLRSQSMLSLSEAYNKSVQEESTLTAEQLKTRHVGKQDPKRHLEEAVERAMGDQVVQNLGTMLLAEL
jgi:26S proteasome regulatory subunit N11